MLDIVVDKSEPDFGNQVLGIPTIFTRKRAVTKLLVRDGGTTVIGGIFQMSATEDEQASAVSASRSPAREPLQES